MDVNEHWLRSKDEGSKKDGLIDAEEKEVSIEVYEKGMSLTQKGYRYVPRRCRSACQRWGWQAGPSLRRQGRELWAWRHARGSPSSGGRALFLLHFIGAVPTTPD